MADSSVSETTQLLRAWAEGDEGVRELPRLAGHCLRNERPERTLEVSDLVHEAYIRLAYLSRLDWQHRNHFFAVSATLMRRIPVDRARKRIAGKRDERVQGIDVEQALDVSSKRPAEIVALDDAMNELARLAPRKPRIVEVKFFAGLEVKETVESGRRLSGNGNA